MFLTKIDFYLLKLLTIFMIKGRIVGTKITHGFTQLGILFIYFHIKLF